MNKKHKPERVVIEYNGMWNCKNMTLPWYWKVEQQITTIDGSTFRKVGRNQILVFHGSYGHSTDDLPTVSKFMLGGQDTIRGYRDDMFRGNSMVLGNIEYRFPSKLHGSYGVGVMLDSPLGLIRVDIGHGSQGNRVHFNVGGTF